jgi:hypothetical protein
MNPFTSLRTHENIERVDRPPASSLFGSVAIIPRGTPEQATSFENHADTTRGSGNINPAINQGCIAAEYVPLIEPVGKGTEANNADAPYRLTQSTPKCLLAPEAAIDEKGQDSSFPEIIINLGGASGTGASSGTAAPEIVIKLGQENNSSTASPEEVTINLGSGSSGDTISIDTTQGSSSEQININLNQQSNNELILNLLNSSAISQTESSSGNTLSVSA